MPLVDNLVHVVVREGLVDFGWLMVEHSGAENDDFLQNWLLNLREWDFLFGARVFDQTLDEDGLLGDVNWNFDGLTVVAKELNCFGHSECEMWESLVC